MIMRSFKSIQTEKIIGYHNNRTIKKGRFVIGIRFGIGVLNMIFAKYNIVKLHRLLIAIYSTAPAISIVFSSINYNFEKYLNNFSKDSLVTLLVKRQPNSIKLYYKHKYSWYEMDSIAFLYIPDIYNNILLLKEANRLCIPILSLIDLQNPINIEYPIYCNSYSLNMILWFSKYIIKIVQKESSFFRKQNTIFKSKNLRESIKLKQLRKKSVRWQDQGTKNFQIFKIHTYMRGFKRGQNVHRKRRAFGLDRFYWRDVVGPWKDFWFKNFKRYGYKFQKGYIKYKKYITKYFIKNYLGTKNNLMRQINLMGPNLRYNKHKISKVIKKFKQNPSELSSFIYDELINIMTRKRIRGYYFLIKNRRRYKRFQKHFKEIWWNRKFLFRRRKTKIRSFTFKKPRLWQIWRKTKKSLSADAYFQSRYRTLDNKSIFIQPGRWRAEVNWLNYAYNNKFDSSKKSFIWFQNRLWSAFYINPTLESIYEEVVSEKTNFRLIWTNFFLKKKNLIIDNISSNRNYKSKHYTWTLHSKTFRQHINSYISMYSIKGLVNHSDSKPNPFTFSRFLTGGRTYTEYLITMFYKKYFIFKNISNKFLLKLVSLNKNLIKLNYYLYLMSRLSKNKRFMKFKKCAKLDKNFITKKWQYSPIIKNSIKNDSLSKSIFFPYVTRWKNINRKRLNNNNKIKNRLIFNKAKNRWMLNKNKNEKTKDKFVPSAGQKNNNKKIENKLVHRKNKRNSKNNI